MTERIDIYSTRIVEAFLDGVENYQPILSGSVALEEEGGVTDVSERNLGRIRASVGALFGLDPLAVFVGAPGVFVLFMGPGLNGAPIMAGYLATGFSYGYGGTGPTGFARYLARLAGCGRGEALEVVCQIPPGAIMKIWSRGDTIDEIRQNAENGPRDVRALLRDVWPGSIPEIAPAGAQRAQTGRNGGASPDSASERRAASRFGDAVRDAIRRGR